MSNNYTVGAELEFYICSADGGIVADLSTGKFPQKRYEFAKNFEVDGTMLLKELAVYGYNISQESGPGQYEVQFGPFPSADLLNEKLKEFQSSAKKAADKFNLVLNYSVKPFEGHCGNGFHVHYCSNLFDPYGLIANNGAMQAKIDPENQYVLWSIGGMLENANKHQKLFFPKEDSLKRLVPYLNAPTKLCWGRNNRSCAIRIPDSKPKRIEHRIAGADVNFLDVINAVIADAEFGIANKIEPGEPVYGNAWDAQYKFKAIV